MFQKFTPFRIGPRGAHAEREAFIPCGASQPFSMGFIPHANGQAVVHGVELMLLETKSVPADVVKRKADAIADKVQQETGRRPKGKAFKEIKEQVVHELLPTAFPKRKKIAIMWLDELLLVGSTTGAELDLITAHLIGSEPGLAIDMVPTERVPGEALTLWAREPGIADFAVGTSLTVATAGDGKAVFSGINVLNPEVEAALEPAEALVTKLALSTDRAEFTLSDDLRFSGVKVVATDNGKGDHADTVSVDCVLWRAELSELMDKVREALSDV